MNTRAAAHLAIRVVFLLVCVFFAWRVFDGRWGELGPALDRIAPWRVALCFALTVAGLVVTSRVWARVLGSYGADASWRRAAGVFFVGQVGKYIPGSVWSIGVQARLARTLGALPSAVVGTGLVFLALHVASGMVIGGIALALSDQEIVSRSTSLIASSALVVVGAGVFHPAVLIRLGRLLSGGRASVAASWGRSAQLAASMGVVWSLYSAAVVVLVREPVTGEVPLVVAAMTLSYVVGVLVVVAPAGLGAREAMFVALLAPSWGLAEATALALLARLVHTGADFLLALLAWRSLPRN